MDAQSDVFTLFLDPVMAMAVIAVTVLVGSVMRDWREARRKRADPRLIILSEHLGAYRPNQRVIGQGKSKA